MRANITNKALGEKLDLDHTSISRYRSGERHPSLGVMAAIAREYNWDMLEQYNAMDAGSYASQFEDKLIAFHGKEETDDAAATAETPG